MPALTLLFGGSPRSVSGQTRSLLPSRIFFSRTHDLSIAGGDPRLAKRLRESNLSLLPLFALMVRHREISYMTQSINSGLE